MAHDTHDLGFIGLGLMGQAFTRRMVACGHRVTGYDLVADKMARAGEHGVHGASCAAEVARASAIVHVSVMTKDDLAAAVFGPNGVAEGAARGKVLVDHSTTEVEATRQFAARLETDTGMRWVDAPVSGGPPQRTPARSRSWRAAPRRTWRRCGRCSNSSGRAPTWGRSAPGRSPRWSTR